MTPCAHASDVLQAADDRTPCRRAGFRSGQGLRDHLEQHSASVRAGKFSFGDSLIVFLLVGS
jgi:hypothetical protein